MSTPRQVRDRLSAALEAQDPQGVAAALSIPPVAQNRSGNNINPSRIGSLVIGDFDYGAMFAALLDAIIAAMAGQADKCFQAQTIVHANINKALGASEGNWLIPAVVTACKDTYLTALAADTQESDGNKHAKLESSVKYLQESYSKTINDRTEYNPSAPYNSAGSKKAGVLPIVNQLIAVYFKLNLLRLCKNLIRPVETQRLQENGTMGQMVTYRYYIGRLNMYEDQHAMAEKNLDFAFSHCHRNAVGNKRRILKYLVPIKMYRGRLPHPQLLEKYGLTEFKPLLEGIRKGDLRSFQDGLLKYQDRFIRQGTYLLLEKCKTCRTMPKPSKKRKTQALQSLDGFNLTGLDQGSSGDALTNCLAEFNQPASTAGASISNTPKSAPSASKSAASRPIDSSTWEQHHVDRTKFDMWNRSFLTWMKTGNYPPGLLPSVDEEIARHFHVKELSTFLLQHSDQVRMPTFERWLLDTKLEDDSKDPVLPVGASPASRSSDQLRKELAQHGIAKSKADEIVRELCRTANLAGQELVSQSERYSRTSPLKKGDKLEVEDHGSSFSLLYTRKKWKKPFCIRINTQHLNQLKESFFKYHNGDTPTPLLDSKSPRILRGFYIVVFCLLLRYSSLSGGQLLQDLRGGGMQGAIHEQVFDVLQSTWDCPWIEGFASPFNRRLPVFGSAFYDLDWHFGSVGGFLETNFVYPSGCCCEANPPFSPLVMEAMVNHMEKQLGKADAAGTGLTFCIIVPTVSNQARAAQEAAQLSFERMLSSEHFRLHVQLAAREHGYIEGAQHLRPTRYKQSSYDTSVIVLQSQEHSRKELDQARFQSKVKEAFASRHEMEHQSKKKKGSDDADDDDDF
eukprot:Nitzschia sp. Nitz4//scaffold2_size372955//110535//113529//NITZ4_000391-RA/size372955-processed-gene-0.404-mRNA-1//1//CDS//3329546680//6802//frame0